MKVITNKNEHGFALLELVLIIFVLGIIGFGAWKVADKSAENSTKTTEPTASSITPITADEAKVAAETAILPLASNTTPTTFNEGSPDAIATTRPASAPTTETPTQTTNIPASEGIGDTIADVTISKLVFMNNMYPADLTQEKVFDDKTETVAILPAKKASDTSNPAYSGTPNFFGTAVNYADRKIKQCAIMRTTGEPIEASMLTFYSTKNTTDRLPAARVTVTNKYQGFCTPYEVFSQSPKISELGVFLNVYNPSNAPIHISKITLIALRK